MVTSSPPLPGSVPVAAAAASPSRRSFAARVWGPVVHAVLDLPVGAVLLVGLTVLGALAVSLVSTVFLAALAVPVAWALYRFAGWAAGVERLRASVLLGVDVNVPVIDQSSPTPWGRVWQRTRSGATWKQVAYLAVRLPVGVLTSTVVLVWLSSALAAVTLPLWVEALPVGRADLLVGTVDSPGDALPVALAGAVGLVLVPLLARVLAAVDGGLVRGLLGASPTAELQARVGELAESRARAVSAADEERRRIERDLHDGAQQRLVALALNLGRARERWDTDPEGARELVDEAHRDAKAALAELRDLARGIRPAILGEQGLDPALSALAARAPVPVDLSVDVPRRPPASIEGLTYFFVSEALANVAKHARASRVAVTVRCTAGKLFIEVTDDGVGGADPAGHGLTGLADRVESVDGWFQVLSPEGGPTTLFAELPCE